MSKNVKDRVRGYGFALRDTWDRFRQEDIGAREACMEAWAETRKLFYRLNKGETSHNRKQAIELVKRGMTKYNEKNYTEAEELFRRAVGKDAGYGRAHAYLGNTLYKLKRLTDAISCWNKAIEVEPNSDAADLAKEKLLSVNKGSDGLLDAAGLVRTRG